MKKALQVIFGAVLYLIFQAPRLLIAALGWYLLRDRFGWEDDGSVGYVLAQLLVLLLVSLALPSSAHKPRAR